MSYPENPVAQVAMEGVIILTAMIVVEKVIKRVGPTMVQKGSDWIKPRKVIGLVKR